MRRRGLLTGRRGPGLLATAAQTAVIAGTATAVSRGVSGAMEASAQQQQAAQEQQRRAQQQQIEAAARQAVADHQAQAQQATAPPAAVGDDRIARLQQLAVLKQQGILDDAEFAAEKARILAS